MVQEDTAGQQHPCQAATFKGLEQLRKKHQQMEAEIASLRERVEGLEKDKADLQCWLDEASRKASHQEQLPKDIAHRG